MEIYKHYYPGYGSVEKQFQARYGKKPEKKPIPFPEEFFTKEEDGTPVDLLTVFAKRDKKQPIY